MCFKKVCDLAGVVSRNKKDITLAFHLLASFPPTAARARHFRRSRGPRAEMERKASTLRSFLDLLLESPRPIYRILVYTSIFAKLDLIYIPRQRSIYTCDMSSFVLLNCWPSVRGKEPPATSGPCSRAIKIDTIVKPVLNELVSWPPRVLDVKVRWHSTSLL